MKWKTFSALSLLLILSIVVVFSMDTFFRQTDGLTTTAPNYALETKSSYADKTANAQSLLPFSIHWPPVPPEDTAQQKSSRLLDGRLHLQSSSSQQLEIQLQLIRPSLESHRMNWNSRLAFQNVGWMNNLKVWDASHRWLWPNLPYLLKLPGQYREQRYGGVDPGRGIDNDFAAVLIRAYDLQGNESATTAGPLVSANWTADSVSDQDKQTVVHQAFSDQFVIDLRPSWTDDNGSQVNKTISQLRIWLIFADFLYSKAPRQWPREGEWNGGILAYFEVQFTDEAIVNSGQALSWSVRHLTPPESTQFDWGHWVFYEDGYSRAEPKLKLDETIENRN